MTISPIILNQILMLRFTKDLSYEEISENLKVLKQRLKPEYKNLSVPTDKRTVKIICEQYEQYKDKYCKAYANDQTDQFFDRHPVVKRKKPGGELSEEQKKLCHDALPDFLASREKKGYYDFSYKRYYEWLIENYPVELTYKDIRGDRQTCSYATVMKYLKEWYHPSAYVE